MKSIGEKDQQRMAEHWQNVSLVFLSLLAILFSVAIPLGVDFMASFMLLLLQLSSVQFDKQVDLDREENQLIYQLKFGLTCTIATLILMQNCMLRWDLSKYLFILTYYFLLLKFKL